MFRDSNKIYIVCCFYISISVFAKVCNIIEDEYDQYGSTILLIFGDFSLAFLTKLFTGEISRLDIDREITF